MFMLKKKKVMVTGLKVIDISLDSQVNYCIVCFEGSVPNFLI